MKIFKLVPLLFTILFFISCAKSTHGELSDNSVFAPVNNDPQNVSESFSEPPLIESDATDSEIESDTDIVTESEAIPVEPQTDKYYFNDYLGVSRVDILSWLKSHEFDDYYLGTPYGNENYGFNTDSCMRPNGRFYDNMPYMTCTGFVLDVLMQSAGENAETVHSKVIDMMYMCEQNCWANDVEYYRNEVNAYYWGAFFRNYEDGKIEHRFYESISDLLNSSSLRKGDIIFFMPDWTIYGTNEYNEPCDMYGNQIDCHIGFYWGEDYSGENLFWHSMCDGLSGEPMNKSKGSFNQISELTTPSVYTYIIVVPLG